MPAKSLMAKDPEDNMVAATGLEPVLPKAGMQILSRNDAVLVIPLCYHGLSPPGRATHWQEWEIFGRKQIFLDIGGHGHDIGVLP